MENPYKEDAQPCEQNAPKSKRKKWVATILATFALAAGFPAQASEFNFTPVKIDMPSLDTVALMKNFDELVEFSTREAVVTAYDLTKVTEPRVRIYSVQVGLENESLFHVYDDLTDTWVYVDYDPRER